MTIVSKRQPRDKPAVPSGELTTHIGRLVRPAGIVLILITCGIAGFLVGRFSGSTIPSAAVPDWEYRLPELSGKISETYRATIHDTGVAVSAAMDAHPQSPSAVSALALLHYLAHDRAGEERCWERCLQLDPKNALAYSRLVALSQQNANYARIVELMHQALRLEPGNGSYRSMLGSALMYLNRPSEAREQLEKNLASGNADAETFLLIGEVYNQLNRPEKAKRFLSLASDLAPLRPDALYGLVKVCNKLGETEAAKEYLAQFEKLKAQQLAGEATREELLDDKFMPPRIAEIVTFVGKSYLEHGEVEFAESYFRRAAEVSNQDVESRKMLTQLMSSARNWREALRWTKELRQLEPENSVHYWNEGIFYDRAKMFADSERVFRDFCRLRPAEDAGYAALAALYLQSNRKMNEARSLAERAVELGPTARNYWLLGSIAQKQGDKSTARAALKRAVELDPQNSELAKAYEATVND